MVCPLHPRSPRQRASLACTETPQFLHHAREQSRVAAFAQDSAIASDRGDSHDGVIDDTRLPMGRSERPAFRIAHANDATSWIVEPSVFYQRLESFRFSVIPHSTPHEGMRGMSIVSGRFVGEGFARGTFGSCMESESRGANVTTANRVLDDGRGICDNGHPKGALSFLQPVRGPTITRCGTGQTADPLLRRASRAMAVTHDADAWRDPRRGHDDGVVERGTLLPTGGHHDVAHATRGTDPVRHQPLAGGASSRRRSTTAATGSSGCSWRNTRCSTRQTRSPRTPCFPWRASSRCYQIVRDAIHRP